MWKSINQLNPNNIQKIINELTAAYINNMADSSKVLNDISNIDVDKKSKDLSDDIIKQATINADNRIKELTKNV